MLSRTSTHHATKPPRHFPYPNHRRHPLISNWHLVGSREGTIHFPGICSFFRRLTLPLPCRAVGLWFYKEQNPGLVPSKKKKKVISRTCISNSAHIFNPPCLSPLSNTF